MTKQTLEVEIQAVWPCTPLQEGLFALHQLVQGQDPYHIQLNFRIEGAINTELLRRSFNTVLHRYPNLKAAFFSEGLEHPIQIIQRQIDINWRFENLEHCKTDNLEKLDTKVIELAEKEFSLPFDLTLGAPIRVYFLRVTKELHYLVLTAHHIVIDGWSLPLFFSEWIKVYHLGNQITELAEPPSYEEYLSWLGERDLETALQQWEDYLSGFEGPSLIATSSPSYVPSSTSMRYQHSLTPEKTNIFLHACQERGITPTTAFILGCAFVLGRRLNPSDIVFGLTISGRPSELETVDRMIGLFINTIPCRVQLNPYESLENQSQRLQDDLFRMQSYGYVGLAQIQRRLKVDQLFDCLLIFQNTPGISTKDVHLKDAILTPLHAFDATHYPLTLVAGVVAGQLQLKAEVGKQHIRQIDGNQLILELLRFLEQMLEQPRVPLGRLSLSPKNLAKPKIDKQRTVEECPQGVWSIFRQQVLRSPSEEALVVATSEGKQRTYTWIELEVLARQIALLMQKTLASQDPFPRVGILLPRNEFYLATILACIKLQHVLVPLDYAFPPDRIEKLVREAKIKLVVTDQHKVFKNCSNLDLRQFDFTHLPLDDSESKLRTLEQELYIIFTSGSTGVPKGVVVTHSNILALLNSHQTLYLNRMQRMLKRGLRVGHVWSFAFDAAWQPLICFLCGNKLILLDEDARKDPELLLQLIKLQAIDFIETSPTLLRHLDLKVLLASSTPLKILGLGGEEIDIALWQKLNSYKGVEVFNFYGPTENTVDAVAIRLSESERPVIGRALSNTEIYVLDPWLRCCATGIIGELYLGGAQIAQGYLNNSSLTASHFVAQAGGKRLYRTGDLVSLQQNGTLVYHGRRDAQVKIRGFRVEPAELENQLLEISYIDQVKAFPVSTSTGLRLAAAITWKVCPCQEPEEAAHIILRILRERIPHYLMPYYIVAVDFFPTTTQGKLDVKALPQPSLHQIAQPLGAKEMQLSKMVASLLNLKDISQIEVEEDFRNLGLDSIMLIQLSHLLRQAGYECTPRSLASVKNIRELAQRLTEGTSVSNPTLNQEASEFLPTPIMSQLLCSKHWQHFCQWMVLKPPPRYTDPRRLNELFQQLSKLHPMLRLKIITRKGEKVVTLQSIETVTQQEFIWATAKELKAYHASELKTLIAQVVDEINPQLGRNLKGIWFPDIQGTSGHLMLFIHHLAVDSISWRIILDDLEHIAAETLVLPQETTSFARWSNLLQAKSSQLQLNRLSKSWQKYLSQEESLLGTRLIDKNCDLASDAFGATITLDEGSTSSYLQLNQWGFTVEEGLLAVLLEVIEAWTQLKKKRMQANQTKFSIRVDREFHGREIQVLEEYGCAEDDLSRTVGWFTAIAPLILKKAPSQMSFSLKNIRSCIEAVPSNALDFSLVNQTLGLPEAQIEFNYHGQLVKPSGLRKENWEVVSEKKILDSIPEMTDPLLERSYAIELNAAISSTASNKELNLRINMSRAVFSQADFSLMCQLWEKQLRKATYIWEKQFNN
ncbi:MAG: condensation domain-containing protein [Neisseriaceae bacterium]